MQNNSPAKLKIDLKTKITLAALGIFLFLVLLEIGLRLGGFVILSLQEQRNRAAIQQKGTYRIMCLGESTTADEYPSYLEKTLNQRNTGIRFSVVNKGIGGTNTGFIVAQLEANLDKYQPDLVVTMTGINDYGPHMPYEAATHSKTILFISSLRIYKLARLLWLHLITTVKERCFLNPKNNKLQFILNFVHSKKTNAISTVDSFKEAIELNPKDDKAYANLGLAHLKQGRLSESEELFKKALELNPQNDLAYMGLGWLYTIQVRLSEAEELFKKALELNPQNGRAYAGLGELYTKQLRLSEADQAFKKALELIPQNDLAYVELGWLYTKLGQLYTKQGKLSEAEELFKKALELNPQNDRAYAGLGELYTIQVRLSEAEELFKKALEFDPQSGQAYAGLGELYTKQLRLSEAEKLFKKVLELIPQNDLAYMELGWLYTKLGQLYTKQGKLSEAEELFKKALELNPQNDRAYGWLAVVYAEMGNHILYKDYEGKAEHIRERLYNPLTIDNYHKLKAILDKRRIRLVCVQYPMRSVEPLKKIFAGEQGMIFVDNERVFKEAVRQSGFKEYFTDMFAGDFGHCTPKGNRLLAENIANTILKEVFGRNY